VVPGQYRVELTVGSQTLSADFAIIKDPRFSTTPDDYAKQFALVKELTGKLSALNGAVNRIRRMKNQLKTLGEGQPELAEKTRAASESLTAIEAVLVDVNKQSPRDVLRNPAGLNDTLVDLINTCTLADAAPTVQAEAVSRELMANVDRQLAKLDVLIAGDIAAINKSAAERGVAYVAG
jgi:hypothetical protein